MGSLCRGRKLRCQNDLGTPTSAATALSKLKIPFIQKPLCDTDVPIYRRAKVKKDQMA